MNIIIVGGRRGIGQALSELLQERAEHKLIITSRNSKPQQQNGVWQHPLDIRDSASIAAFADFVRQQYQHIDWLINCAGVLHTEDYRPEKSLKQVQQQQLMDSFSTNAGGHLLLIRQLQALLAAAPQGLAASVSARIGSIADNRLGGWYAYRMSKAALNMGLKTLSIEWQRNHPHLKLLLFHPGTTDTDLSAPFQQRVPSDQLHSAATTAERFLAVIEDTLQQTAPALFRDYNGEAIAW